MRYRTAVCSALLSLRIFAEGEIPPPPPWREFLRPVEVKRAFSGPGSIDCIYVINLVERPERWESVLAEFEAVGLYPNRLDAINGWKIPSEQLDLLIDPRPFSPPRLPVTPGEIGCFLSHLSAYQDAIDRGFDRIWVCEDDVQFVGDPESLSSILVELESIDPEWDLLYTDCINSGAGVQNHRPEQKEYQVLHEQVSKSLLRMHSRFGTHSMVLSKRGIEKLLSYFYARCFWSPIDIDLHYAGLREYSVRKTITTVRSRFSSDTEPWSSLKSSL